METPNLYPLFTKFKKQKTKKHEIKKKSKDIDN
jgi:hypothetical protein